MVPQGSPRIILFLNIRLASQINTELCDQNWKCFTVPLNNIPQFVYICCISYHLLVVYPLWCDFISLPCAILHLLIHTQFAFAVQPMVDFTPPVPCGMNLFQAPVQDIQEQEQKKNEAHRSIGLALQCWASTRYWLMNNHLVGGFKHLFSIIYGIILPIDFHIFQDG